MERLALILAAVLSVVPLLALPDATGTKDHPLLIRMQNMYIEKDRANPFDRFSFKVAKGQESPVEGRAKNRRVELVKE